MVGVNWPGGMAIPPVGSSVLRGEAAEVNGASVHREVEVRDIRRDEELMIARSVCRVFGLPTKTPAS
jgi:hypothetical protein